MIKKELLIKEIRKSSYIKPFTPKNIFDFYHKKNEPSGDYCAEMVNLVQLLIAEQIESYMDSKPYDIVCFNGKGYYVAKNRKEAIESLDYFNSKVEIMMLFIRMFQEFIDSIFPLDNEVHPSE
jgi:hypothetical protein